MDNSVHKKFAAMGTSFVMNLINDNYKTCCDRFDTNLSSMLNETALKAGWVSIQAEMGPVINIVTANVGENNFIIADVIVQFEKGMMDVKITFDKNEEICGLFISRYNPCTTPSEIKEDEVIVGEGTKWPLNGLITRNSNGKRSDTAVVLVHGSGPSDKNETVGANSPFRDLAWYLCKKNIDSIRYDKRTFVYGTTMVTIKDLSVEEETIEDAILAGNILKKIGYKNIYLVGHSMGAMLAPRIISESDGLFKGFASLAGSPRRLVDIMVDQNEAFISKIAEPDIRAANKAALDAEAVKVNSLSEWTDEDALNNTLFGVNAYYFKEMADHDAGKIAKGLNCPMLFLQGSADFQVDEESDFGKWKEILAGHDKVDFKLYDGLNHLFMVSGGENAGTVAEYNTPSHIEQCVIDDLAEFLKE